MSLKNINLTEKKESPSDAFMSMLNICKETTENTKNASMLPIDQLIPFPDHKTFHKYSDEKLKELSDNIREYGVLSPVIVRPIGTDQYQILAGHNRTAAAQMAGLLEVPCTIKEVDDNTAKVIFVATNLNQRDTLLPSEKAFAYKLLKESDKCQFVTMDDIAEQGNENKRQIFRYLRLTYLIKPLIDFVDAEDIPFMAGVNISYLNEDSQQLLYDYITSNEFKIRLAQAEAIKSMSENGVITTDSLNKIFIKNKTTTKKSIKLPMKEIRDYFTGLDDKEIVTKIVELIKNHSSEVI